uniref:Molecular chaperone DnaJ n=2 Tax=Hirondellea gigas TaxID=1518452 RepID=A0A6A7G8V3_9CRUS
MILSRVQKRNLRRLLQKEVHILHSRSSSGSRLIHSAPNRFSIQFHQKTSTNNVFSCFQSNHFLNGNSRNFSSSSKEDYYDVLGVNRESTEGELKKSYFKLAKKYHPDANPSESAKAKFQQISHAYDILGNSEKRKAYDLHGHSAEDMSSGQSPFGAQSSPDFSDFASNLSAEDLYAHLFGGQTQSDPGGPIPGDDIALGLRISFMEAVKGCKREISVEREAHCSACGGSGNKSGSSPTQCSACDGKGNITRSHGMMFLRVVCNACGGSGMKIDHCRKCHGQGTKMESKTISVAIPQGVDTGTRVRLSGQGNAGRFQGPRGDLFVQIQVDRHPEFDRDGADVHLTVDLSFVDAILGTKIDIPTLSNDVTLTVKPGTQPGEIVRIRERGIKRLNRPDFGDQLIHFNVHIPKNVTNEQSSLLQNFRKVDPDYIDAVLDGEVKETPEPDSVSDSNTSDTASSRRRRRRKQSEKASNAKDSEPKKSGIFDKIFGSS